MKQHAHSGEARAGRTMGHDGGKRAGANERRTLLPTNCQARPFMPSGVMHLRSDCSYTATIEQATGKQATGNSTSVTGDGQHSKSANVTVGTSNLGIRRSALQLSESDGLQCASSSLPVSPLITYVQSFCFHTTAASLLKK